ncbi:hypothetical protein [Azospirillum sp. TSO5]|uniref:hypothetical protein n=1 Tax=Azospirillum sp. TSO5 TaxID=716760 RepID=UPI000D618A45|nr:hypothetical protein [Azospirillum sp. TSO5]PWC96926.1 hypothetical protein TSO5_05705 [Azospirillum sp. TSO5]
MSKIIPANIKFTDDQLRAWCAAGMTDREICAVAKVNPSTVSCRRRALGIAIKSQRIDPDMEPGVESADRFLKAFARRSSRLALPENSKAAEIANSFGRLSPAVPAMSAASSLCMEA